MSSQHAVIIGGSSGIGLATARRLLASGMQVTITGRSEQRLDEARQSLGGATGVVLGSRALEHRSTPSPRETPQATPRHPPRRAPHAGRAPRIAP